MLPQVPAMIAPENHNGASVQVQTYKLVQDFSDLSIGIADTGIVPMNQFPGKIVGDRSTGRNTGISPQLTKGMKRLLRGIIRRMIVPRKAYLFIVNLPIFFGSIEGQVRFLKPCGQEEGLIHLL